MNNYLLKCVDIKKHFPIHGGILMRETGRVFAVDGVSLGVREGRTFGLVGESGCGKSTFGRTILKLHEPTSGEIWFDGNNITGFRRREIRPLRRHMQIVFQDPYASLNPRFTVERTLTEPLEVHGIGKSRSERRAKVEDILGKVGLD